MSLCVFSYNKVSTNLSVMLLFCAVNFISGRAFIMLLFLKILSCLVIADCHV